MSKLAIRVQDLGKQYTIGVRPAKGLRRAKYNTLRDTLVEMASNPGRLLRRKDKQETIWALRDVNFEVTEGEVVGLIGRNGAGKSTLLKVLSRITEPTTGWRRSTGESRRCSRSEPAFTPS
jgi:lipopolysaccharide transport system ATP-binding protein